MQHIFLQNLMLPRCLQGKTLLEVKAQWPPDPKVPPRSVPQREAKTLMGLPYAGATTQRWLWFNVGLGIGLSTLTNAFRQIFLQQQTTQTVFHLQRLSSSSCIQKLRCEAPAGGMYVATA